MPYLLSALAKQDVAEIRTYISARNPEASLRLSRHFRSVFLSIGENPEIAKLHSELSELLGEPVRTRTAGAHVILYRSASATPEIFAVLHGARDIVRILEDRFF